MVYLRCKEFQQNGSMDICFNQWYRINLKDGNEFRGKLSYVTPSAILVFTDRAGKMIEISPDVIKSWGRCESIQICGKIIFVGDIVKIQIEGVEKQIICKYMGYGGGCSLDRSKPYVFEYTGMKILVYDLCDIEEVKIIERVV